MARQVLRGYEVLEKIKDGSVGTVWLAKNSRNDLFALKQISAANAAIPRKLKLFKREATLTKDLRHPHIVRVHAYVDAPPQPFFVMEHFPSENLKVALFETPERIEKHVFDILQKTAQALQFIHSQNVIHKDLKPENVLINAASDIRLIDLSLAQTKWDRMLQFGRKVEGTPTYMAPEQIQGKRCDPRTDIYAFGVMMFELLAKRPPYMGTTEHELLHKHVKEPVPSLRSYVPTLSPELDAFVRRLLAKKADDRFQDMATVVFELGKWRKKKTLTRLRQVRAAQ